MNNVNGILCKSGVKYRYCCKSRIFGLDLATWVFQEFSEIYKKVFEYKLINGYKTEPVMSVLNKPNALVMDEFEFTTIDLGKFFIYKEQAIYFISELINRISYFGDPEMAERVSDDLDINIITILQPYLEIFLTNYSIYINKLPSIGLSSKDTVKFYIYLIKHTNIFKTLQSWIINTLFIEIFVQIFPIIPLLLLIVKLRNFNKKDLFKLFFGILLGIFGYRYIKLLIDGFGGFKQKYRNETYIMFMFGNNRPEIVIKTGYDFCKIFKKNCTEQDMIRFAGRILKYYQQEPHRTHEVTNSFNTFIIQKQKDKNLRIKAMQTFAKAISYFSDYYPKVTKPEVYNFSLQDSDKQNTVCVSETIDNKFYLQYKLQKRFNDLNIKVTRPITPQCGDATATIGDKQYFYDNKRSRFSLTLIKKLYFDALSTKDKKVKDHFSIVLNVIKQPISQIIEMQNFCKINDIKVNLYLLRTLRLYKLIVQNSVKNLIVLMSLTDGINI